MKITVEERGGNREQEVHTGYVSGPSTWYSHEVTIECDGSTKVNVIRKEEAANEADTGSAE